MICYLDTMITTVPSKVQITMYCMIYMIYRGFFVHTSRGQSVVPCLSHQKKRVKPQQINVVM